MYGKPYLIPALYTVICNKSSIENLLSTSLVSNDRTFFGTFKVQLYLSSIVLLSDSTVRNLLYTVNFIFYIAMIGDLLGTFVHMDIR